MKKSLLKQYSTFFGLLLCLMGFAQNSLKLPDNAVFYMELNGKQLNNKMDWAKFNPILKKVFKNENKGKNWADYSEIGIDYNENQYHYATYTDSVKSYSAHMTLDNAEVFKKFINSIIKEGLEITKKDKYSFVSLDKSTFVAWNSRHAVVKIINYQKPYYADFDSDEMVVDSASVVVDSATSYTEDAVDVEGVAAEKSFDYKEEILYLEEEIGYYEDDIKEFKAEIEKLKKDIAYLKKHHKYPKIRIKPEEQSEADMDDEDSTIEDDTEIIEDEDPDYLKRMDSINIAEFKIIKDLSELSFDEIFNSNFQIEVPNKTLKFKDSKSDLFAYTNFGNIFLQNSPYKSYGYFGFLESYFNKMYNADASYNLFFEKDNVRILSNYQHADPKIQKSILDFYNGNSNKKLGRLLTDKSIGYFAMNIDSHKSFDFTYDLIKELGTDQEYQNEIDMMVETMKIILDEKAISKILPGNGIFILNDLASKKVEYTAYDYDDDYNEIEVIKTKDTPVPDFTFAFVTENEDYWSRLFKMFSTNKKTGVEFQKKDFYYEVINKESNEVNRLIFAVKDGIVYITTSPDHIGEKVQSSVTKKWAKEVHKHSLTGWLDTKRLISGLENEFSDVKNKKAFQFFVKNMGEIFYKTDAKKDNLQTEVNYKIDNNSENSVVYFLDLFNEIIDLVEPENKPQPQ